jgi:hypothetical protein
MNPFEVTPACHHPQRRFHAHAFIPHPLLDHFTGVQSSATAPVVAKIPMPPRQQSAAVLS